jgi:hypothetical protein
MGAGTGGARSVRLWVAGGFVVESEEGGLRLVATDYHAAPALVPWEVIVKLIETRPRSAGNELATTSLGEPSEQGGNE